MTELPAVDLYLRKSSKDEGKSVERQRADLVEAAERDGITLSGREFVDPMFSASRYARRARPDYAALLDHILSGACQAVGVLDVSRGGRNVTDWSTFLDLCRTRKVKIWVSTHERMYDLSRRRDWRALIDEGVDAADDSERKSELVRSGKRKAAREGKPAGRLPYGFTRKYDAKGKLIEQAAHPEQAPIVAEIVDRVAASTESLSAIARDLNARGAVTGNGGPWDQKKIRQTVLNPSYAGRRVHQGEDLGQASASWKPIVDVARWHVAVARLTLPGRSAAASTALRHWLSGVPLCGACRLARLRHGSRSGGCGNVYRCKSCHRVTVSATALETVIESLVLARLAKPDAAAVFAPRTDTAAVVAAHEAVVTLEARLQAHYAEAARGVLSAGGLAAVEGLLLPDIARAKDKARRLSLPPDLEAYADVDIGARWHGLPAAVRRGFTLALAEIVVAPTSSRGRRFDVSRLGGSRWVGDERTWGEG